MSSSHLAYKRHGLSSCGQHLSQQLPMPISTAIDERVCECAYNSNLVLQPTYSYGRSLGNEGFRGMQKKNINRWTHVSNFFNFLASFLVATETDFVLMTNFVAATAMSIGGNQQSCGPYSSRLARPCDGSLRNEGFEEFKNYKNRWKSFPDRVDCRREHLDRTPADSPHPCGR